MEGDSDKNMEGDSAKIWRAIVPSATRSNLIGLHTKGAYSANSLNGRSVDNVSKGGSA